jgi:hypothetical protein
MDWLLRKYPIVRALLWTAFFVLVATALLGTAWRIWHTLRATPLIYGLPSWAWIDICGGGAAISLAAALFALNRPRQQTGAHWLVCWALEVPRRVLLVAQLGAAAVGIAPLGMWLLSYPLPLPK